MKILITDHVHALLPRGLQDLGYEVDYQPDLDLHDLVEVGQGSAGLIINSKIKLTADRIAALPDLRFVGRLGSGLEIIDLSAAAQAGVQVYSAPDGNCQAVAEHALGMLLSLFNKLCSAHQSVRNGDWDREAHRGLELHGRKVGIIGFGHTGPALAKLLAGFECDILVHDVIEKRLEAWPRCRASSLEQLFAEAEIVSLHVSYSAANHHMVNAQWIDQFAHPFYLINTSRGMVVDLLALQEALERGQILGACLDVFENEKPATFSPREEATMHYLGGHPKVLLSPHVAGWTVESKKRIAQIILTQIRQGAHLSKST